MKTTNDNTRARLIANLNARKELANWLPEYRKVYTDPLVYGTENLYHFDADEYLEKHDGCLDELLEEMQKENLEREVYNALLDKLYAVLS